MRRFILWLALILFASPAWADSPSKVVFPPGKAPNLKFSHALHEGIRCQTCHGDMSTGKVGLATRAQLPRMAVCLQCHDGKKAPSRCTTCHLAAPGGMVRTAFPAGTLIPSGAIHGDDHGMAFRTGHARVARDQAAYCENCHRKEFCVDCHDGIVKPFDFHAGDYVALHAIDARRQQTGCTSCHRMQSFCTGCHARTGVNADPRTSEFTPSSQAIGMGPGGTHRFHPEGWVSAGGGRKGNDHSFQAQRNLRTCASCHREEQCLDCHATRNPHPPGWATSRRCRALASRSARMCLRCHVDTSATRCE